MSRRGLCILFRAVTPWPALFVLTGPASPWPYALGLLWLGLLVLLRPPVRPEVEPRPEAVRVSRPLPGAADVLLREAPEALSWSNALAAEIGPWRLAGRLEAGPAPRLTIIPAGARLSDGEIRILETWVRRDGAAALLECPGPELSDLAGETVPGGWRETAVGRGRVFALGRDHGRRRRELTQGRPQAPDGRAARGWRLDPQGFQSPDLRADAPADRVFEPEADLADREIFDRLRQALCLPSYWHHPRALPAAFVLSFDEDWAGCDLDAGGDTPATWFLTDGCRPGPGGPRPEACALHWNRFLLHLTPTGPHLGLSGLKGQLRRLAETLGHVPDLCRVHYLRFDARPARTWRIMAGAGLRVDASLGPGRGQHGYRFGTGRPYRLADERGRDLGLIEVPFHIHEPMGRAPLAEHLRLLDEAVSRHHGLITALHHPLHCREGGASRDNYLGLVRHLASWPGWITTLAEAVAFWDLRQETGLTSVLADGVLTAAIPGGARAGLTLRLPRPEDLLSASAGGQDLPPAELVVLPEGATELTARYRHPDHETRP